MARESHTSPPSLASPSSSSSPASIRCISTTTRQDSMRQNEKKSTAHSLPCALMIKSTYKIKCRPKLTSFLGKVTGRRNHHESLDFKYDAASYALNFDDGWRRFDEDSPSLKTFLERLPVSPIRLSSSKITPIDCENNGR